MTLSWSSSTDSWQLLREELEAEAELAFSTSGEIILVTPDSESGSMMTISWRSRSLKLTYCPDRGAVRWDTPGEYGFERIPEETTLLARSLMRRLCR